MTDILSLLLGDDPEQARAQADHLRRQMMLGRLGQMTNDPAVSPMASGMVQEAQHGQDQLNKLPMEQMQLSGLRAKQEQEGMQTQKMRADLGASEKRRNLLSDPNSPLSKLRTGLGNRLGLNLPAGTPGEMVDDSELNIAEKAKSHEETAAWHRLMAQRPVGGGLGGLDKRVELNRQKLMQKLGSPPADWEWAPEAMSGEILPPNLEEVKQANKIASGAATIMDLSEHVKDFFKKHPNGAVSGNDVAEVEPFVQGIQVMARTANDMGVYRAYDAPLLDKIVRDPTTVSSVLSSASGFRDLQKQFGAFLRETGQRAYTLQQQVHRTPKAGGRFEGFAPKQGAVPGSVNAPVTRQEAMQKIHDADPSITPDGMRKKLQEMGL